METKIHINKETKQKLLSCFAGEHCYVQSEDSAKIPGRVLQMFSTILCCSQLQKSYAEIVRQKEKTAESEHVKMICTSSNVFLSKIE